MSTRMLRVAAVMDRTGLTRRTLYALISDGEFPRGVQLSTRCVAWPEADIEAWLTARIATRDEVAA